VAEGESPGLVSVVVTTKNEERNIRTCLDSIAQQTYAPIEIIVVDNASTDRTKEIAQEFTEKVYDAGLEGAASFLQSASAQRNFGMLDVARGNCVMYVDADMVASPNLVAACVDRLSRGDCVALHISEIVLGRSFFSRVRRFERRFYDGTVIDAARFLRRDVLAEFGGFDETLTAGEDWDLDKKIKGLGAIALVDADPILNQFRAQWRLAPFIRQRGVDPSLYGAVLYHNESEFDLRRYLTKKRNYASWFAPYQRKWGRDDPDVAKQLGAGYRLVGVFVEHGKWRRLVRNPVLSCGMYFLRAAVGTAYLLNRRLPILTGS
jgi:glycosyltransferase involved in cell wall biosynthesis